MCNAKDDTAEMIIGPGSIVPSMREELLRSIIDAIPDMIGIQDLDHRVIMYNEAGYLFVGKSLEEVRGKRCFELIGWDAPCKVCATSEVYLTGRPARVKKFVPEIEKWLDVRAYPIRDEEGRTAMIVEHVRDITDEVRITEMLQRQTDRAEFYLDLLSHDISNLHQGILMGMRVHDELGNGEVGLEALRHAKELLQRSIRMSRDVLFLSRLGSRPLELVPIDLCQRIEGILGSIKRTFPDRTIDLRMECPQKDAVVMAEPIIDQAFFNILHNAVKFQKDPAVIEMSGRIERRNIHIEIADHGPGIPDKVKETIFDRPGSKDPTASSGVGLSLVDALIKRYSGSIEVQDRVTGHPEQGSRFVITLPLIQRTAYND